MNGEVVKWIQRIFLGPPSDMLLDATTLDCGAPLNQTYPKMKLDTLGNCTDVAVVLSRFSESAECEVLNFVPVLSLNTLSLDSQKVQNCSLQCAQKMSFSQDTSSLRLFAILLNVRTLNGSSSFCSL